MTSRHYSSDTKEVSILIVVDCFKSGVKLGVFNIAIYGKTVRRSFNSFEQCTFRWALWPIGLWFIILLDNLYLPKSESSGYIVL